MNLPNQDLVSGVPKSQLRAAANRIVAVLIPADAAGKGSVRILFEKNEGVGFTYSMEGWYNMLEWFPHANKCGTFPSPTFYIHLSLTFFRFQRNVGCDSGTSHKQVDHNRRENDAKETPRHTMTNHGKNKYANTKTYKNPVSYQRKTLTVWLNSTFTAETNRS